MAEDEFTTHQKYLLAAAQMGREIPTVDYLLDELVEGGFLIETTDGVNQLTQRGQLAVLMLKDGLSKLVWPETAAQPN